jgi:hypothetical protein
MHQHVQLKKALYGFKQAARLWYEEIKTFLLSIGLTQSTTDPNLHIQTGTQLLLYVDDMLITHTNAPNHSREIKGKLSNRFRMKDLGRVRHSLEIEVDENYNISQKDYITQILQRLCLKHVKPALSPIVTGWVE